MITEKLIQTTKTARYCTIGNSEQSIKKIWFVFHGYGQLAKEFIKNFEVIVDDQTLIVAPEALNKFYLRGFNGKIGATWMTKEDRENEINNYVEMIDSIYKEIVKDIDISSIKINVLGFSQGTHTAVRWLDRTNIKVDNLLLWSGTFPHDCNYRDNIEYWSNVKTKIILGTNDRFISEDHHKKELEYLDDRGFNYDLITYENGHEIDLSKLLTIAEKL